MLSNEYIWNLEVSNLEIPLKLNFVKYHFVSKMKLTSPIVQYIFRMGQLKIGEGKAITYSAELNATMFTVVKFT